MGSVFDNPLKTVQDRHGKEGNKESNQEDDKEGKTD